MNNCTCNEGVALSCNVHYPPPNPNGFVDTQPKQKPKEHPFPGNELVLKYEREGTGPYSGTTILDSDWTDDINRANLLSSEVVEFDDEGKQWPKYVSDEISYRSSEEDRIRFWGEYPTQRHRRYHRPVLDIDFPVKVIPSSTEGHFHLYMDIEMPWPKYKKLLEALSEAGIIEPGYAEASINRMATHVRLPWIKKSSPEDSVHKGNESL